PEGLRTDRTISWQADWYDLVRAYGQVKARNAPTLHTVRDRQVMTLESALDRVSNMLGLTLDWMVLEDFLPAGADKRLRKSAMASSFVAALELARTGRAELAQDDIFGPLRLRRCRTRETA
ncbi:MAG: segregation/condensation protein A, partial [Citromicrobium sp.]|nr:segregation/condensation protein A [Citromicrobium sp.]